LGEIHDHATDGRRRDVLPPDVGAGSPPMSTASTRNPELFESVRQTIENAIVDVVGRDYYEECDITLDSTFAEDVELESMEVMEIAEKLMETYEGKVDFVAWFSDMELEDLVELSLGDLVGFIVDSLEKADAGQAAEA
jgi:acyl carrier protein